MENLTPMLRQYREIKSKHSDCILFFRLGDFYEMFYEDAVKASGILDLVLTSRDAGKAGRIPMCGIPFHAADSYIGRLIKQGFKVAICEQTEDPSKAKGIVKREVVRIISAGTYLDETSIARCLISVVLDRNRIGIAFLETTGGKVRANQYSSSDNLAGILAKMPVYEIVYPESNHKQISTILEEISGKAKNFTLSSQEDWKFNLDTAIRNICEHFEIQSVDVTDLRGKPLAIRATGGLLEYVRALTKTRMHHIDKIALYDDSEYVYISPSAIKGLEIEALIKVLDRTNTAAGKRLLREWIMHPLKDVEKITERQQAVMILKDNQNIQTSLVQILKQTYDIEKALSRLSSGYLNPKDIVAIKETLNQIPDVSKVLEPISDTSRYFQIGDIQKLREILNQAINPDLPPTSPEGEIIKKGFSAELDFYRNIKENANQWLKNYQSEEAQKTGIGSLKIGYTQVFGYYIEISKANLHLVPDRYTRKQTLVNAERFITPELKDFEEKMLSSQQKIVEIENNIVKEIVSKILEYSKEIHQLASSIAALDVLVSFCIIAREKEYVKPEIDNFDEIIIKDGRHPLVESFIENRFIPNDTLVDCRENRMLIITGPNMAGKSTYIRQVAILVIMAQSGSFIPASSAKIGLVDKVFARIGAHDEIAKGQSTFMVEMSETASILSNLSPKSLVILDEIGRGTSTYDGLSLAWAVAEYLYEKKIRTLFATHFHELVELERTHPYVKNYNVAVKQWQGEIIFLHKIVPGGTDQSYGIYVAKLAGIPSKVIERSKEILKELESGEKFSYGEKQQFFLFSRQTDSLLEELKNEIKSLNPDEISPLQALQKIYQWKKLLE
ncbi:MAG: DNA mismatch repair protein MutS [Candidatus Omnitrophica bacterium]|nr:DNA mismatch repair protein MutS [Candidatus Omnitrophota bacterium]